MAFEKFPFAFEAVLWAMPAADTLVMRCAQKDWEMKDGEVFYFQSRPTGKTDVVTVCGNPARLPPLILMRLSGLAAKFFEY